MGRKDLWFHGGVILSLINIAVALWLVYRIDHVEDELSDKADSGELYELRSRIEDLESRFDRSY